MARISLVLLLLFVSVGTNDQIPEWKSEVVIKADYGDEEDEYGFEGIVEVEDTSPVSAFYIDYDNIYISDRYQHNIKVYNHSGNYIRTVSIAAKWEFPDRALTNLPVTDFIVRDGIIYLLCERGTPPPEDQTNIVILTFDLETEGKINYHIIFNPMINRRHGSRPGNATYLKLDSDGNIWIYDLTQGKSFMLFLDGKEVPRSEYAEGIPGDVFGSRRLLFNEEKGAQELINNDGSLIREIPLNKPILRKYSSKNGEYFLSNDIDNEEFIISTWDGRNIGRVKLERKESWCIYQSSASCHLGPDGRFYRVFAGYNGVFLYRWSK